MALGSQVRKLLAFLTLLGSAVMAAPAFAGPIVGQGTWETTLQARDINGYSVALSDASAAFFYDTTLDITWLAQMNQPQAQPILGFGQASAWVNGLPYFGGGWRLPTIIDTGELGCGFVYDDTSDCGFNVDTQVGNAYSEWAHLYYVTLGNSAPCPAPNRTCRPGPPQPGSGLTNTAYFQNMYPGTYWSGTLIGGLDGIVMTFDTTSGWQDVRFAQTMLFIVAVRDGDVAAAMPEPATIALVVCALLGITATRRREPKPSTTQHAR